MSPFFIRISSHSSRQLFRQEGNVKEPKRTQKTGNVCSVFFNDNLLDTKNKGIKNAEKSTFLMPLQV